MTDMFVKESLFFLLSPPILTLSADELSKFIS